MDAVLTLICAVVVVGGSAATGQAVMAASGAAGRHHLAPVVGLAVLLALAWAAVNLVEPWAAAVVVIAVPVLAMAMLGFNVEGPREEGGLAVLTALLALSLAIIPFLVEGRFGILGTGLNPDMAQHLFAADTLVGGGSERLIAEGYPLGPHAFAVGLSELTGAGLVQAFSGLTIAVAPIAALTVLGALSDLRPSLRLTGALVGALAYLAAAFLVQGAFKETMQALFVLAFALAIAELARSGTFGHEPRHRSLLGLPLAALAIGSIYAYSFPGLAWLAGTLGVWGLVELWRAAVSGGIRLASARLDRALPIAAGALVVFWLAIVAELGRIFEFARFETFDPDGDGLGNLFDRISPFEALGIWPSGDFRLEPGAGAAPAIVFWLGAGLALGLLARELVRRERAGETVLASALAAAAVIWLWSLTQGTPYQEAKAIVIAAPLATLLAFRGAADAIGSRSAALGLAGLSFIAAAAGSSLLALANGPVGPSDYSPAGNEVRPIVAGAGAGSTLVLLAPELRAERGDEFVGWELRGGRICFGELGEGTLPEAPPAGIARVVTVVAGERSVDPPFLALELEHVAGPYAVWERLEPPAGDGPCPPIDESQRAK